MGPDLGSTPGWCELSQGLEVVGSAFAVQWFESVNHVS
jgi:hypothetical protein